MVLATKQLERKIRAHLEDQQAAPLRERREAQKLDEIWTTRIQAGAAFQGQDRYHRQGLPNLDVHLLYPRLRVQSPFLAEELADGDSAKFAAAAETLGRELAGGVVIQLQPSLDLPVGGLRK